MPHPIRDAQRKAAERKASAQQLVDYFAKNHPELLVKLRTELLEAAHKPGLPADQVAANAWRHLISRLRFLKSEGVS